MFKPISLSKTNSQRSHSLKWFGPNLFVVCLGHFSLIFLDFFPKTVASLCQVLSVDIHHPHILISLEIILKCYPS
jgi:hypothetical protein